MASNGPVGRVLGLSPGLAVSVDVHHPGRWNQRKGGVVGVVELPAAGSAGMT